MFPLTMDPLEYLIALFGCMSPRQRRNNYAHALRSERRYRDQAKNNPDKELRDFYTNRHRRMIAELRDKARAHCARTDA